MRLLTVGDSFTWGQELDDNTSAWPYLLSARLEYTLDNQAKPGSGNLRMVRYAIEHIDNYDMIIVAWTHFARNEFADDCGFFDIWPGFNPKYFKDIIPHRVELIEYFNKHHNDDYMYRQYLINIILLQKYLMLNNKRYLMLDAFGNHQYSGRTSEKNKDLLEQIDATHFVGWPDKSMMEWTWGTEMGAGGHFLEKGHVKVAEKLFYQMENLSWVN